ncbi:hypothetical protein A0H81_08052 [Grifola frondosa]|uniref:Uncharacterized protein n=1 Tax=Grifola frondosa TaxID=5627 RepID=A0A1C7M6Z8_GRIFR|nr:hypothetical protein A0H81_08052 [Grifola frondosa]
MADKLAHSLNGLSSEVVFAVAVSADEMDPSPKYLMESTAVGESTNDISQANSHPPLWLTLTLFRHGETMEYLIESNDVVPASAASQQLYNFEEQDHGPRFRELVVTGHWQAAARLKSRSCRGRDFRNYKPDGGESLADLERRCIQNITMLMHQCGQEVSQHPEGLNEKLKAFGRRMPITKLPGHPRCQPDTLPIHIPHVGVVSHNLLLTEMLRTLLSWNSERQTDLYMAFENADWARVVICWNPSAENVVLDRSNDLQRPGQLDVWFLKAPSGSYYR